jgi:hypothetical protein
MDGGVNSDATNKDINDAGVDVGDSAEKNESIAATATIAVSKNKDTEERVEQQTSTAAAESTNTQVAVGSHGKATEVPNVAVAANVTTGVKTKKPVKVSMTTMLVDIIATSITGSTTKYGAAESNKISTAATNVDPTIKVASAESGQPVVVVNNEPD